MKVTVFTSNQARHIHLINRLSSVFDTVYAIQECNTVFPGKVKDFFNNTPIMQKYFSNVIQSEKNVFGNISFSSDRVKTLSIKTGDLNNLNREVLSDALDSDYYIVFGSSYIKGWLIDFLTERQAVNIHMGASPYYRGSSCNFWAAYDGNLDYVGATIHMLSKGLDSGDMLFHALPKPDYYEPFDLGMHAVKVAHEGLIDFLVNNRLKHYKVEKQDKGLEIKYTKNADFIDQVAQDYLQSLPSKTVIYEKLQQRDLSKFIRPYIG